MLKDTIISAFNYDGTLLKWLKKVEDALKNASASEFRVNKKGNATISFSIVFANGDTLESGDIILQQGESVTGATIRQGHLILTLSNGNELDAGDIGAVTGFSINESQHLIVTYQNGTTQDLGAIFSGNVNINGTINATKVTGDEIVETMTGYSWTKTNTTHNFDLLYVGACKNGNKLSLVVFGTYTYATGDNETELGRFYIPNSVHNKLTPYTIQGAKILDQKRVALFSSTQLSAEPILLNMEATKQSTTQVVINIRRITNAGLTDGTTYYFRYEITFLLSDNMA